MNTKLFEQKGAKETKEGRPHESFPSPSLPSRSSVNPSSMHPKFKRADEWSRKVIGAAIEVHREKGPGLLEPIYEKCLMRELFLQKIPAQTQLIVPIEYKGYVFDEPLRLDVYVDDCLLVELKAVEEILPVHKAQLLSYMKLLDAPLGLLFNFHELKLVNGLHRLILPGADGSNFGIRAEKDEDHTP